MKSNLTSMDFDSIKNDLKDFFKKQDYFKDYNFEGSGLNILLDVLAYNSQNNAYLANMLANEAEIDSAVLRSNVVSRAKLLGYTPKSNTASRAVIALTVEDATQQAESLLLPRGTRFSVKSSKQQFVFVTLQEYNLKRVSPGKYANSSIEIFEGTLKAYSFDVNSNDRRYVIPSKTIDTSTLRVAVYENDTTNEYEVYQKETSIQKIDSESKAFWVYETDNGLYELKFGDGVFGKKPEVNSVIYCEYLETNASVANDLTHFTLVGSFKGYENADIKIETINASSGGSEQEATISIKINAPRFFQSQNRAITKDDYAALTYEIFPYAKSVAVWGGEETNPPKFGKVFISIIPRSHLKLTSSNKKDLQRKLKARGMIGIDPVIVDPNLIHINMTVKATIRRGTNNSLGNLSNQIRQITVEYFSNEFGIFDSDFHYSNLLTVIKNHSRAINGVRTDFSLSMVLDSKKDEMVLNFENGLEEGSISSTLVNNASIKDKDGLLLLNGKEVGKINYGNGTLTLKGKMIPDFDKLEIFAVPLMDDVQTGFGSALVLNESRLSVELLTE